MAKAKKEAAQKGSTLAETTAHLEEWRTINVRADDLENAGVPLPPDQAHKKGGQIVAINVGEFRRSVNGAKAAPSPTPEAQE